MSDGAGGDRMRGVLAFLLLVAIVAGVGLRFAHLERKLVWYDEAHTWLRLAGATEAEVRTCYDSRERRVADLSVFLHASAGRGYPDVVRVLAAEEPHQPPLYFVLARAWTRLWGDGTAALRGASAVASTVALALVPLLVRALGGGGTFAVTATALVAVSPLHVRYAQEARPYALFELLVVLASLLLVRACARPSSRGAWTAYAGAMAAAWWTHLLALLVVAAHALVVLAERGANRRIALRRFTVATAAACLAIAPWLAVLATRLDVGLGKTDWSGIRMPLAELAHRWVGVVTSVFLRTGGVGALFDAEPVPAVLAVRALVAIAMMALIAYALVVVGREAPARTAAVILALVVVPALALAIPDLVGGGRRSAIAKYVLPSWLGLELAVAFLLARRSGRRRWRLATGVLVAAGLATCVRSAPLPVWWDVDYERLLAMREAAARVNAAVRPVVVTDAEVGRVLVLLRRLDGKVRLRLVADPAADAAPVEGTVFLYDPSPRLRAATTGAGTRLEAVVHGAELDVWQVRGAK